MLGEIPWRLAWIEKPEQWWSKLFYSLFYSIFLFILAILAFFVPRTALEYAMGRIERCLPKAGRTSLAYAALVGFVLSALILLLFIGGLFLAMELEE